MQNVCMCSIWVRQFFTLKKAEGWLFIVFISDVSDRVEEGKNHILRRSRVVDRWTIKKMGKGVKSKMETGDVVTATPSVGGFHEV